MIEREVKIILSKEANKEFELLNRIVGKEKLKGLNSSFHQTFFEVNSKRSGTFKTKSFFRKPNPQKTDPKKIFKKILQ